MAFLEDLVPYLNRCLQLLFPPSEIAQTLGTILSFLLSVSVDYLLGEGGFLAAVEMPALLSSPSWGKQAGGGNCSF